MSDQDTIFNSEETPAAKEDQTEATSQPTNPAVPDPVSEYVGEGKKYSNIEAFAKAFKAAQEHIQTLENENKTYREELETKQDIEKLLEEMKRPSPAQEKPAVPQLDEATLESLVERTLTKKEQEALYKNNTKSVVENLTAKWGSKAEEIYNQAAIENGMTIAQMNQMAATAPKAVLKLLGLSSQATLSPSTSSGSVNTETMQQAQQAPASAKVPDGAGTKDMVKAWRAAAPTT